MSPVLVQTRAGGGRPVEYQEGANASRQTYGIDEKGRITKRTTRGGTKEVRELEDFVYKALKKIVGEELRKPKGNGYRISEAVGQLLLYPSLIGIEGLAEQALLILDQRALEPVMAAALDSAGISVLTHDIEDSRKVPRITFPDALIERFKRTGS